MHRYAVSVAGLALLALCSCGDAGSTSQLIDMSSADADGGGPPDDGPLPDLDASLDASTVCHADAGDLGLGLPPFTWAETLPVDVSERWTWTPPDSLDILSVPVLASDGTIYLWYGNALSFSNWMAAISPEGDLIWETWIQSLASSCPAVGTDGNIYGLGCGHILVVEPTGDATEYIFRPETYGNLKCPLSISCPSVGPDNTVYFLVADSGTTSKGAQVYAYRFGEGIVWTQTLSSPLVGESTVSADGETIYVPEQGATVALYASSGDVRWMTPLGEAGGFPVPVGSVLYTASGPLMVSEGEDYHFIGLRPQDGCVLWDIPQYLDELFGNLVGPEGETYDSDNSAGLVLRQSSTGEVEWSTPCSGDCTIGFGPIALGADGTLFAGENPGTLLYALSAETGEERWTFDLGFGASKPVLAPDGTLYLIADEGLHAIQTDSPGLANAPWPRARHDNRGSSWAGATP